MADVVGPVLDWVCCVGFGWVLLAVGVFMSLESSLGVGYVVPGDSVLLVAASGAVTGIATAALLVAVAVAGSLAGESVGFAVGRSLGPRVRRTRVGRWVGPRRWERADDVLRRRGGVAVLLSRFLPGLHAAVPVVVGSSPMPYRRFLAWTTAGAVPWAAMYVGAGWALGSSYRAFGERVGWLGWGLVAVVALWLLVSLARQLVAARRRRAAAVDGAPGR